MKLLQITESSGYPPTTGAEKRFHGLVAGRRSDDQVWRFAQCPLSTVDDSGRTVEIEPGYKEHRSVNRLDSVLGYLTGRIDAPQVFTSSAMRFGNPDQLHEWLERADVVQVEEPWLFDYVYAHKPDATPIVYSSHNFVPELYDHLDERLVTKPFVHRIRRVERRVVDRADIVVVCSDRDGRLYESEYDADGPFYHIPHGATIPDETVGVDKADLASAGGPSPDRPWALFVGSTHEPNVTAVNRLVDLARSGRLPDAIEVVVVGSVGTRFDPNSTPSQLQFEGYVDDLNAYYQAADIALNPVETGAGSNVKLAEYLAHGLPVVTTPFGARGYPITDSEEAVVVDADEFGVGIHRLVEDSELRTMIGRRARELAAARLNWSTLSRELFERLRAL